MGKKCLYVLYAGNDEAIKNTVQQTLYASSGSMKAVKILN
jgi:hypothetical protein